MFEWISSPEAWAALATLLALEIILGIDNIIFISILVSRLPEHQRNKGRIIGLSLAMATRLALLFSISWVMGLTSDLFSVFGKGISGRDLILIGGGLFLVAKATHEIHNSLEGVGEEEEHKKATANFTAVIIQIAIIDIVFSLDSVITAVGLVDQISIMVIAIVGAVIVMMIAAKPIGDFIEHHPSLKMLALSFLILVGFMLVIEGWDVHVPKGYIYFAMAFSISVEMLNIWFRKRQKPLKLHKQIEEGAA